MIMTELPLRVALVTMSLRQSGAEKQFLYLARALRDAGAQVRIYHLVDDGYYLSAMRDLGIPVISVAAPSAWQRFYRLVAAVRAFSPHIVQANHFGTNFYAVVAARSCGALALGAVRSSGTRDVAYHGWRGPVLLRLPDAFVVNSHPAATALQTMGIAADRLAVLPNVIDFSEPLFSTPVALPDSVPPKRVLAAAVGRLLPLKRVDLYLRALAMACRQAPDLFGVVMGEGSELAALKKLAAELDLLPHRVVFLGHRPDAVALLKRMSFLVLSSTTEGFPNVVQEAMAQGVPVIATPAGEAAILVRDMQNGLSVAFDDVNGMAAAMARLARDPGLRAALGSSARAFVRAEYPLETLGSRILDCYRQFVAAVGRPRLRSGPAALFAPLSALPLGAR